MASYLPQVYEQMFGGQQQRANQQKANSQQNFLAQATNASNQANAANKKREAQVLAIYDEMVNRYQPGGSFETKSLAELDKQKSRFVEKGYASETQGNISSGIYGTTTQTGTKSRLDKDFEAEVGAPSRLRLEDVLMQRLSGAQTGKAQFLTGIQDEGPSLSQLYGMGQAAGSSSGGSGLSSPSPSEDSSGSNLSSNIRLPGSGGTGGSVQGTGHRASGGTLPSIQASSRAGGGSSAGTVKPHVDSFKAYFNYMATMKNKGLGTSKTQQEAFSKLKASGWTG